MPVQVLNSIAESVDGTKHCFGSVLESSFVKWRSQQLQTGQGSFLDVRQCRPHFVDRCCVLFFFKLVQDRNLTFCSIELEAKIRECLTDGVEIIYHITK